MRRTLSSPLTFLGKCVFPVLWIVGVGLATCQLWLGTYQWPNEMKWSFLALWLIGTAYIWWSVRHLMRVEADDEAIYVSNCRSEVRVPLTEISIVKWSLLRGPRVTVHLRRPCELGQRVDFIPKCDWDVMWWSGTRAAAKELEALRKRAEENSLGST